MQEINEQKLRELLEEEKKLILSTILTEQNLLINFFIIVGIMKMIS